jgi:hypothetical protein
MAQSRGRNAVLAPFMSKEQGPAMDVGTTFERIFCDTLLFMLTLKVFCEAGHVDAETRHAYSIRLRLLRNTVLV